MSVTTRTDVAELGPDVPERLRHHLERIYPSEQVDATHRRLLAMLAAFADTAPPPTHRKLFDERDVVLITYADQVREPGKPPLETLRTVLNAHVAGVVSGVHLLPHYPSTSDDGFAVADYLSVDPTLGDWRHVEQLARTFRIMLDAVVNHTSASSHWFRGWLAGDEAYEDFYLAVDPQTDLSPVTRPRTTPLLTPFEAHDGTRWVWSTFSPDQVDLNYRNPEVLLRVCEVLLRYVEHGASILRLDAIAFLWKELGTSCVHLPQTHEIIKLWRTMLDSVAPGTVLITETNVPHHENISYFGSGHDEAHLVYQFPLAPLVLSAFHRANADQLRSWLRTVEPPATDTAFLNFLGCHDGIGLRPVEGLLPPEEIDALCALTEAHGGGVSYRTRPDGTTSPYELNTVYFDALNPIDGSDPFPVQIDRFLAAQSILLALAGVPAVYFHALFGSRNWTAGIEHTGRLRSINRQKLTKAQLEAELNHPASVRSRILEPFRDRIAARVSEPAFHPEGPQRIIDAPAALLVFERHAPDRSSHVLCITNLSAAPQRFHAGPADGLTGAARYVDLCHRFEVVADDDGTVDVDVPPYGVRWLRAS